MNRVLSRLAMFLGLLFVSVYMGYQFYQFLFRPYKTETVFSTTISDSYMTKALVVRDETVINVPIEAGGIINYLYKDAEKVHSRTVIAEIYEDYGQIALKNQIGEIEKKIALLEEANNLGTSQSAHIDILNRQIVEGIVELDKMVDTGTLSNLSDVKSNLLKQISKKQLITGKVANFDGKIKSLTEQKNNLAAQFSNKKRGSIQAGTAGYFVSKTDGYENVLQTQYADTITYDTFQMYLEGYNGDVVENSPYIGKIITNYKWYFVIAVPNKMADRFLVGRKLTISFPNINTLPIEATIENVLTEEGQTMSMITFSSKEMSPELSVLRCTDLILDFQSFTGIKIPETALRIQESDDEGGLPVEGVFVKEKNFVKFKRVVPIYEENNFIISEIDNNDPSRLQIFDDVIIEGTELKDGKALE